MTAKRIQELQRNDLKGAMAYARQESKVGGYTPEVAQQLLMLQDDPGPLMDALASARLRVARSR